MSWGNDDPYDFEDYNPALDTQALEHDQNFQTAVQTRHGKRPPPTGFKQAAAGARLTTGQRLGTAAQKGGGGDARPMTAVRAAGYTATGGRRANFGGTGFSGAAPPLEEKKSDDPEEKFKEAERKVHGLIEQSCGAGDTGDLKRALDFAKEAGRAERVLTRQREQAESENFNVDLTYWTLLNLATRYAANEQYTEALNSYQVMVKNKMFSNSGRLKINVGNLYLKQGNYSRAVKQYRMALDQIPSGHKVLRMKIMQNIGIVMVKLSQYAEAIQSFEYVMNELPNVPTGFNLLVCYFIMGERDMMKKVFQQLLSVDLNIDEDRYLADPSDTHGMLVAEAVRNDPLRQFEKKKRYEAERLIKTAAKLVAPAIENTFDGGYDWCIDQVKSSRYSDIANDLEIDKAIMFLKQKDFSQAVAALKTFEKRDSKMACTAAVNLSFLHYLGSSEEKELQAADKYSELALASDRYNPSALVNKANVLFQRREYERAREYYKEALQNDSSCAEALYNLGLSHKQLGSYGEALDSFYKLHNILKNSAQVIYQLAHCHELNGQLAQASESYLQLVGLVPSEYSVLQHLGELADREGDMSTAFQYYYDSYRYNPSNIPVIEWLGAYYIESQFCEKAISYFQRAAVVQPQQVKWPLMVASCHRRSGNYAAALDTYKQVHRRHPDDVECLKFLVRISTDMALPEAATYAEKLKKAEKARELRDERTESAGRKKSGRRQLSGGGNGSRNNSASAESRGNRVQLNGNERYQNQQGVIDTEYNDPLAGQRPKTAARRGIPSHAEDDFANEELGDDLLPE